MPLDIDFLDVLDILLVAILIYQLYKLVKGTVAINIFIGVFAVYLFWQLVKALQMELLSEILGQFIGVGVIALIIVFQQELRKFLLVIGTTSLKNRSGFLGNLNLFKRKETESVDYEAVIKACFEMSKTLTGAIVVITRKSELGFYAQTGDLLDAKLSERLLRSIFYKNSPLHDGAVIISGENIVAARAILPVTEQTDIPAHLGMRHRAAIGITEKTDAIAIVVSEQNGNVSYAVSGKLSLRLDEEKLTNLLKVDMSM